MYVIRFISADKTVEFYSGLESISECDKTMKDVCKNNGNMYIRKLRHPYTGELNEYRVLQFKSSYVRKHCVRRLICFVHYMEITDV